MDDTGQDGWTVRHPSTGRYRCWINLEMPPNRVRFTMAHEVGHIVLHHLEDLRARDIPENLPWIEREADVFAEELLMPWEFFDGCGIEDLRGWSEWFGVSREACAWRLLQMPKVMPVLGMPRLRLSETGFSELMAECGAEVAVKKTGS